MPYPAHESQLIGSEYSVDVDMDLCNLLQTMKLDPAYGEQRKPANEPTVTSFVQNIPEEVMEEDTNYHSDTASESSNSKISAECKRYGCAYLQVIQSQLENCQTTGGEYLDIIFTHREILFSYPTAHQECARAFTDLAYTMEKRAWRADRDADTEAVSSFRHEAWVIASSLAPVPANKNSATSHNSSSSYVCHGMAMM